MEAKRSPRGGAPILPAQGAALKPVRPQGGGASAPARRQPSFGETLDQLNRDLQQLRVDFERFFNGALHAPPDELRGRIQAQLRNLRGINLTTAVDSFRLGDIEARFNSYNELFNRRLRDLEEGRHPGARHAPPAVVRRYDPMQGILFGERIDPEAAEALYQGLAASPGDSLRFDLDSFQTYLARQVAAIRDKTGCSEVQFRLASEDGKLKLKARPVTSREGI
ncbi:MAG: MXAN_5187 C-terminal domain-containing protein [Thermoanaerobaculia bacterium]